MGRSIRHRRIRRIRRVIRPRLPAHSPPSPLRAASAVLISASPLPISASGAGIVTQRCITMRVRIAGFAAFANVVVQQPQQGVGVGLLTKATLHPHFEAARLHVVPARRALRRTRSLPRKETRGTLPPSAPCPSRSDDSTANPRATQRSLRRRPSWRQDRGVDSWFGSGCRAGGFAPLLALSDRVSSLKGFPADASGHGSRPSSRRAHRPAAKSSFSGAVCAGCRTGLS